MKSTSTVSTNAQLAKLGAALRAAKTEKERQHLERCIEATCKLIAFR